MSRYLSGALIAVACLATAVASAREPDRANGLRLSREVCADCHAVSKGEVPSPRERAPPFSVLAAQPGMTETALAVALTTPHAGMPMFRLTAPEREDVIAYILGLR